jgi:futalosine hydrolase
MDFVVCAATEMELSIFKNTYAAKLAHAGITYAIHGIGSMVAATYITNYVQQYPKHFFIQIGIAGAIDNALALGTVIAVATEQEGNLGVIEEGGFKNLSGLQLAHYQPDVFSQRLIYNNESITTLQTYLSKTTPIVNGVTVQEITTNTKTLERFVNAPIHIETMEGAAMHYAGNLFEVPYLQLRGISNYVMERNKKLWNIPLAIENVSKEAYTFIKNYANAYS